MLDEIGERETIHVTDEEMHEEMHRQAEREGQSEQDLQERYSSDPAQFNRLVTRLYHRKTVQFLLDNAEVTEEIVEPEAAEEDSADTASERGDSVPPEQEADRTDE